MTAIWQATFVLAAICAGVIIVTFILVRSISETVDKLVDLLVDTVKTQRDITFSQHEIFQAQTSTYRYLKLILEILGGLEPEEEEDEDESGSRNEDVTAG